MCATACQRKRTQNNQKTEHHDAKRKRIRQEIKRKRGATYRLHAEIHKLLCTKCLSKTHKPEVEIFNASGETRLIGVVTCKGVWFCNVCRARILRQKQAIIQRYHGVATTQGCYAKALTLTLPENPLEPLKPRLDRLKKALRHLFRNCQRLFGIVGRVAVIEISESNEHGWNPHVHVVLYTKKPLDLQRFTERWECAVEDGCNDKSLSLVVSKGINFSYLCKGSAPWHLVKSNPDKFKEYIKATKGVRCVQILMQRFKVGKREEPQKPSVLLAVVKSSVWKALIVSKGMIYVVLDAAADMNMKKLSDLLGAECIRYWPNPVGPPK